MKRHFFQILTILIALGLAGCRNTSEYIAITGPAQGGTYTVKLNLRDSDGNSLKVEPEQIRNSIDSIINVIDFTLSGYNKGSILSKFNSGETVKPNKMFCDMYEFSYRMFEQTNGAIDVAAGPLFDIWGFGFTNDSLPSMDDVLKVMKDCGMERLEPTINIKEDGTFSPSDLLKSNDGVLPKLNFNAVAQGYSCDLVADYLHSIGVKDMLVDIGEIRCEGLNPNGIPWNIAVDRPIDGNMELGADTDGVWVSDGSDCGIVTSGNYRKFYIKDGQKFAHTIDPRTGTPVDHSLLSATIVAKTGAIADAYATYCMVLGLEEAREFIKNDDTIEGYLIYDDHGTMKEWASDGFKIRDTEK